MTKTERVAFLRQRLRAVRGYDAPVMPCERRAVYVPRRRFFVNRLQMTVGAQAKEMPQAWITQADSKAEGFKEKQRHGTHPLTKIAEKLKRSWHR